MDDDLPPALIAAMETAAEMAMAAGGQRLLVIAPRRLEEAQQIIEAVREYQCVVLQSAHADEGVAQRLIDFSCGGMAALDGQVHRIDAETFLFAPALARVERL
jgi:cell division inhibitor SepF